MTTQPSLKFLLFCVALSQNTHSPHALPVLPPSYWDKTAFCLHWGFLSSQDEAGEHSRKCWIFLWPQKPEPLTSYGVVAHVTRRSLHDPLQHVAPADQCCVAEGVPCLGKVKFLLVAGC